ncbi:MAG: hypothetical protein HFH43_03460 [Lachnospiraceae bacterium]|nr:hypothetical protein [Lachnospiraceae bacterium]
MDIIFSRFLSDFGVCWAGKGYVLQDRRKIVPDGMPKGYPDNHGIDVLPGIYRMQRNTVSGSYQNYFLLGIHYSCMEFESNINVCGKTFRYGMEKNRAVFPLFLWCICPCWAKNFYISVKSENYTTKLVCFFNYYVVDGTGSPWDIVWVCLDEPEINSWGLQRDESFLVLGSFVIIFACASGFSFVCE